MAELTGLLPSRVEFKNPESLLVVRLKEGDEQAFAEAFQLYKNLVYNLSLRVLTDKTEAMDVTQEVFLTLYRRIGRFREECSLKTWLFRVTLNQAASRNRWWRRRRRHRTVSLSLDLTEDGYHAPDLVCSRPVSDRHVLAIEIQKALQEGLKRLPFGQRTAVILRDLEGLSYEEIAEVTGVRIGTVKSRIARGRSTLRGFLEPYLGGSRI